jgi:hypothetical protein
MKDVTSQSHVESVENDPKRAKKSWPSPLSQLCYVSRRPLAHVWVLGADSVRYPIAVKERTVSATKIIWFAVLVVFGVVTAVGREASAQQRSGVQIEGQVQAGGGPLADSTVTLWAASRANPNN